MAIVTNPKSIINELEQKAESTKLVGDVVSAGDVFIYQGRQHRNTNASAITITSGFPATPIDGVIEHIGDGDFNTSRNPTSASTTLAEAFNQRRGVSVGRGPGQGLALDIRELETRVKTVLNKSIASGSFNYVSWDTLGADELGGLYSTGDTTTLTIPAHLDGDTIEIEALGEWEFNATGLRQMEIVVAGAGVSTHYNRKDNREAFADTNPVVTQNAKWRGRVVTGATIRVRLYQSSGGALNFNGGAALVVRVLRRQAGKHYNAIANVPQGDYATMLPTQADTIKQWAKAGLNIITHPYYPEETGGTLQGLTGVPSCLDGEGSADWRQLVMGARRENPHTLIFAYAAPTIDAPGTGACGYDFAGGPVWSPPGGDLPKFRLVIEHYASMPASHRPDGIFLDIVADFSNGGWINAAIRDKAYEICREHGFLICANTTNPSFINLAFAADGLGAGDWVMCEGWEFVAGVSSTANTTAFMAEMDLHRHKGVAFMGIATSAIGVAPSASLKTTAITRFHDLAKTGDALAIHDAGLAIYTEYETELKGL